MLAFQPQRHDNMTAIARAHERWVLARKRREHVHSHVYREGGHWVVVLTVNGLAFDTAGPFPDEYDATEAACRMGDEVHPSYASSPTYQLGDRGADE